MPQANAAFSVVRWDENPYMEKPDGEKLTRSEIKYAYTGDMVGESELVYLMHYTAAGAATFVGLEYVTATLDGKSGTFVFKNTGIDNNMGTHITLEVVEGSGTGELTGLQGTVTTTLAGEAAQYNIVFDYSIA